MPTPGPPRSLPCRPGSLNLSPTLLHQSQDRRRTLKVTNGGWSHEGTFVMGFSDYKCWFSMCPGLVAVDQHIMPNIASRRQVGTRQRAPPPGRRPCQHWLARPTLLCLRSPSGIYTADIHGEARVKGATMSCPQGTDLGENERRRV